MISVAHTYGQSITTGRKIETAVITDYNSGLCKAKTATNSALVWPNVHTAPSTAILGKTGLFTSHNTD